MSLVDTREIATAKIVMLGGTGGSNVEGNPTGSATEYLSKLQIDDTIFETAGVIPFDVTLINNSDIHISAVNAGQLDGKTILINTTTHTGTTSAGWFLKINQSTSYEMITPEGRSFKDAMSDNMAMIVRLDASQAEATVLGVLGADSSDVVSGLGIGKKTSVSNNVIITDIDLHRAPMAGDRLLIWFDASVQNPTGLTTYNNGTAVTSNLENVSPLSYNAGWNIVQFMNDGLLYNNVWVRKQNVPLPIDTLSGLSDTAIASPSDGQLLTYDNDSQKWKNKTYVEANTGFPVTELKKLKVGNIVYDTDGMKNYSVTNVANNNITVSVLNSNQFVQEVIAINTGNHTGSSSAWNLVLTDGMNPVSVALKNADGSPFADDISENELLFVYVDTAGNVARVLEIHSHDVEVLKDICITEKTVSGNPITLTDALPYPAVSVSTEIEPIQEGEGDPSPTNIRPISGRTETSVIANGNNLSSKLAMSTDANGAISASVGKFYTAVEANKSYVLMFNLKTKMNSDAQANRKLSLYLNDNVLLYQWTDVNTIGAQKITITPTASGFLNLWAGNGAFVASTEIIDGIYLVDAEHSNTETISFGQTVYGAKINFKTGEVDPDINLIFDGSADENWTWVIQDGKSCFYIDVAVNRKAGTSPKASYYKGVSITYWSELNDGECAFHPTLAVLRVCDTRYTNANEFKAALAANPLQVTYIPVEYTPFYCAPVMLELLKGYNNISSDGDGNLTLTYKADRLAAIEAALQNT